MSNTIHIPDFDYYVKFIEDSGKVLSISPKEIPEGEGYSVMRTRNAICYQVLKREIPSSNIIALKDIINETWDIQIKTRTTDISSLVTDAGMFKIESNFEKDFDMFLKFDNTNKVLYITINPTHMRRTLDSHKINLIGTTYHKFLNIYVTKRGDPDQLKLIINVDPVELFKNRRVFVKFDPARLDDLYNIDVYTHKLFHKYCLEITNDTPFRTNEDHRLISSTSMYSQEINTHITIYKQKEKLYIDCSELDLSTVPDILNQSNIAIMICDTEPDKFYNALHIPVQDLLAREIIELENIQLPENPLFVYQNNQMTAKYIGEKNVKHDQHQ